MMASGRTCAMREPRGNPTSAAELIEGADRDGAQRALVDGAIRTPTLHCADLTEFAAGRVALKAECLQGTGSFKMRGAVHKVAALGERAGAGLVTGSAGKHGCVG